MIDKQIIVYLQLLHGLYNTIIMALFVYQGKLGLHIRTERKSGRPPLFTGIKKHRKNGQILAFMGICGFLSGVIIVFLDSGDLLKYYFHFLLGFTLVSLIIATFIISKQIKEYDTYWRNMHFSIGLLIICFYLVQLFVGLNVLL